MSDSKLIAKNTLMLYSRQILTIVVSLYTVRVVLDTLGASDYGLYNVVAGVVTMFSFLMGSMAVASQRYFSLEKALAATVYWNRFEENKDNLKQVGINFLNKFLI